MNMIEQIKADAEAGTEGPWATDLIKVAWRGGQQSLMNEAPYLSGYIISSIVDGVVDIDAKRIARVPDMEAALIAADELANAYALYESRANADSPDDWAAMSNALAAYRAAIGAK